jgi:hypothetical protein
MTAVRCINNYLASGDVLEVLLEVFGPPPDILLRLDGTRHIAKNNFYGALHGMILLS